MTQAPGPNDEATTPVVPTTPEQPTVAFGASPTPPAQPTSPYAAPTAPSAPYGAPTPPNAPYSAPTPTYAAPTPPSPYAGPTPPSAPYGAPTPPNAAPTPTYAAPTPTYAAPAAPYTAPTAPTASPYAAPAAPAAAPPYGTLPADGTAQTASPYAVPGVPPVSGQPAYGYPYADQPLSGPPYGVPPTAAPKPRRTAVIVLSIATALLFVASGVLGGMFVVQRGQTDDGNVRIAALQADVTAKTKKLEELQANLDSVNSANILKQQELDGSKNDRNEQERQKKVIGKCLDLLLEVFAADTESEFDKKIRGAEKTCDEADSYM